MAQIVEDYVSFDLAKLLKKKGFDEICQRIYDNDCPNEILGSDGLEFKNSELIESITAPTLSLACKWLREVHNIDIIPFHEKLPNDCYWCRIEKYPYTEYNQDPIYKKYEESLNAAIKYCLENLIE